MKVAIYIALAAIFIFYFSPCQNAFAQNRGVSVKVKNSQGQSKELPLYRNSYALVVGESNYTAGWNKLPGVAGDAESVKSALENQGFQVAVLMNPTRNEFLAKIQQFIDEYGFEYENRLLIYFAGHGYTEILPDGRSVGYIVPSDAPLPVTDKLNFQRKAIDMREIEAIAEKIRSKHALFLFDSCFSGRLVSSRGNPVVPPVIQESVAFAVRQFITAGAANQIVPDESIFRKYFVRGVEGEADRNNDGYILGSELALYLTDKVTNASNRSQTPQYGKIQNPDLDQGDFVFVVPVKFANQNLNQSPIIQPGTTTIDRTAIEKKFWDSIETSTDIEDFKLYKQNYPNGAYTSLADLKIRQLSRPGSPASNPQLNNQINSKSEQISVGADQSKVTGKPDKSARMTFENIGPLNPGDMKGTVDNMYYEFQKVPDSKGVIINYGSDTKIIKRENEIRKAISSRNYNPDLVKFVRGGDAPVIITEFYLVPTGVEIPTPRTSHNISPKEIEKWSNAEQAIELDDNGYGFYEKKEYDKAIIEYTKLIDLYQKDKGISLYLVRSDSEELDPYLRRARAFVGNKEYDKAIADFTKAIEAWNELVGSDSPAIFNQRGLIYYEIKQYNKAIADFTKAIKLESEAIEPGFDVGKVYANRAKAYRKINKIALAQADEQKYKELKAQSAQ